MSHQGVREPKRATYADIEALSGETPIRAEPFEALELDLAGLWGEAPA